MSLGYILTVLSLFARPDSIHQRPSLEPEIDPSYEVYSFVIADRLANMPKDASVYVVSRTERRELAPRCLGLDRLRRGTWYDQQLSSYTSANRASQLLKRQFDFGRPYELVAGKRLKEVLRTEYLAEALVFSVSAVGFNSAKDKPPYTSLIDVVDCAARVPLHF